MLFRPSYCANCGEKVERAEWHLWTSRRFCEVCESEFRGIDLLPKAAAGIGILGVVLAMSGYVGRGSNAADIASVKQQRSLVDTRAAAGANAKAAKEPSAPVTAETPPQQSNNATLKRTPPPIVPAPELAPEKSDGPVYFCGAQTKKGTPCSRRVKGNVRCFQHTGMPAMLPPEKLRVG